MSRAKKKKRAGDRQPKNPSASPRVDPLQTGMPAQDSITGIDEFKKGKKTFRIIHTNETDEYERVPSKPAPKKQP